MHITSEGAAKRFFVGKVVEEAAIVGTPLSTAEAYMLSWSESDPGFTQDPRLDDAFKRETTDAAFEMKAAVLLKAAYHREVAAAPEARESWRAAYAVLSQGDHYILIMLRAALGWRLRRWFFA